MSLVQIQTTSILAQIVDSQQLEAKNILVLAFTHPLCDTLWNSDNTDWCFRFVRHQQQEVTMQLNLNERALKMMGMTLEYPNLYCNNASLHKGQSKMQLWTEAVLHIFQHTDMHCLYCMLLSCWSSTVYTYSSFLA